MTDPIIVEEGDAGIVIAKFNRPHRRNAIDLDLIASFEALLSRLEASETIRVLILTGEGDAFCAGADIKSDFVRHDGPEAALVAQLRLARLMQRLTALRQPVIAAVNGPAVGGGFAFTLAADIRIASISASFAIANARMGLSAGECGISWLLPRAIGLSRAFELMLTGRSFDGREAEAIGYVIGTVADAALMDRALATARLICANAPFGVWMTKSVVRASLETGSLAAAIDMEARTQILCAQTGDVRKAFNAFLEKQPPGTPEN